jgi:ribosomal protein S18 acetylase RimI-like enzyme
MPIHPLRYDDLPALKALIDATGLFPSEMLDDMTAGYLAGTAAEEIWLVDQDAREPATLAYVAPERMTNATWNLLLIAVAPDRQRGGRGSAMLFHVEALLARRGARLLLIETSGLPEQAGARAFYAKNGYAQEGVIRDFYDEGEDKVIFRKKLPVA